MHDFLYCKTLTLAERDPTTSGEDRTHAVSIYRVGVSNYHLCHPPRAILVSK